MALKGRSWQRPTEDQKDLPFLKQTTLQHHSSAFLVCKKIFPRLVILSPGKQQKDCRHAEEHVHSGFCGCACLILKAPCGAGARNRVRDCWSTKARFGFLAVVGGDKLLSNMMSAGRIRKGAAPIGLWCYTVWSMGCKPQENWDRKSGKR